MIKAKDLINKHLSNIVFSMLLVFLVIKQAPIFLENYKKESLVVQTVQTTNLETDHQIFFPIQDRSVLIMWASWCSPCKVEMKRIQNSIESGKIPARKVFAMNLFEDDFTAKNFIKENKYSFTFLSKSESLIGQLEARATPTTYLFEGNNIYKASTGISLIGIYQMENYITSNLE